MRIPIRWSHNEPPLYRMQLTSDKGSQIEVFVVTIGIFQGQFTP